MSTKVGLTYNIIHQKRTSKLDMSGGLQVGSFGTLKMEKQVSLPNYQIK